MGCRRAKTGLKMEWGSFPLTVSRSLSCNGFLNPPLMWVVLFSIILKGQALDSGAKEGGGGEGRSGTQPPGAHGLVPRL